MADVQWRSFSITGHGITGTHCLQSAVGRLLITDRPKQKGLDRLGRSRAQKEVFGPFSTGCESVSMIFGAQEGWTFTHGVH